MASKTIEGAFPALLTSQEEYETLLKRNNIRCLVNSKGHQIYGYAALVDGETYTAGPELAEAKGQQLNQFWIRHWVGQDLTCRQFAVPPNYDAFRKLLMRAFNFPFAGKVYYFPDDNVMNLGHRVLVHDTVTFQAFLSIPHERQPLLYLWKRDQADSPDLVPADQAESKSEVAEDASDTSRGSVQTVWSTGVKNLDGWKCVVCANNLRSTLIGAHVVPISASKEELAARLPTPYEARNGVTMCANCSNLYDAGFFFFERDGTTHVSAALSSKPEWAAREGVKIYRAPQRTDDNWPTEPIIESRKTYYLERQKR